MGVRGQRIDIDPALRRAFPRRGAPHLARRLSPLAKSRSQPASEVPTFRKSRKVGQPHLWRCQRFRFQIYDFSICNLQSEMPRSATDVFFLLMLQIRAANIDDCGLLRAMIRELAEFERLLEFVTIREEDLARDGFGENPRFRA